MELFINFSVQCVALYTNTVYNAYVFVGLLESAGVREAVNQPLLSSRSLSKETRQEATAESERQYLDYIFHQNNRLSVRLASGSSPTT